MLRAITACAALIVAILGLSVTHAWAANIITFDNNATACGGATLCSTGGTLGYSGTDPFNLSTLPSWFQIDTDGVSHLAGQPVEPNGGAGQFLVINDTGSVVTHFSITLTDTFGPGTPSVTFCSGGSGPLCDNFQADKGAAAPAGAGEALNGPDFFSCTNGAAGSGFPCFSTAGQAAANFTPNQVTFNWTGLNIAAGATFDISFASWNNSVAPVPEPATWVLLGSALAGLVFVSRRRRS